MNSPLRLLIPIDFSDASKAVVTYVLNDKQYANSMFILLHTYRLIADGSSSHRDSPVDLKKKLEKGLLENYEIFKKTLNISNDKNNIEFRLEVGFVTNSIHSFCQEAKIDLIIYTIKTGKEHQILKEIISQDCLPIRLLSENVTVKDHKNMETKSINKSNFEKHLPDCIVELESDALLSCIVLPD